MVQNMVQKMFSGIWRRIYRNASRRSFVHFWWFPFHSETLFSTTRNKCLTGYFCVTFRADHFPQIRFFIAPTWGRFWPIFVFGKFSNFRTFFMCFVCIFGVCGPSLLSANAGIMVFWQRSRQGRPTPPALTPYLQSRKVEQFVRCAKSIQLMRYELLIKS